MGVIKRGILGGFSGKVANVIGGAWKGIAYMRSLPLSVANPRTAGQVTQRNGMSACVAFSKQILAGIIKPLWDRFSEGMSGYNAFVKANVQSAFPNGVIVPAQLKTSQGSLLGVSGLTGSAVAATNQVALGWDDNSGTGNALATDEVYVVCLNEDTGEVTVPALTEVRDNTSLAFDGGDIGPAQNISVYFSLKSADGFKVSNSQRVALLSA